ncbi:hypothetical protein M758_8G126000 [Ceratodon purpureus]|nr:hypothetical protein M758_8G126000 [Ceratodon purpureus]
MMATASNDESMDPELWGTLQNHLDLKSIYAKLPLGEFFQLRLVCKEWNQLASDREFLQTSFPTPLARPFFLVSGQHVDRTLNRLLYFDASTRRWNSTPSPGHYLDVDGLLYSYELDRGYYTVDQQVFDLHTRVCHKLPRVLEDGGMPFVALRVDTSISPHSFQVVYAGGLLPTQVYDSTENSWSIKTQAHPDHLAPGRASCAEANGFMYLRSELDGLVTYDVEKGDWNMYMDAPPGDCDDYLRSIGAWQGRLFDVTVGLKERSITAWELVDHAQAKWEAFLRMPEDLFSWITYEDNPDPPVDVDYDVEIRTSFCGEYVLVYTWLFEEGLAARFVMGNLDTKAWEKVDVPFGSCCILHECAL